MPPSTAAGKVAQAREGTAMQEEGPTGPGYLCAQHLDAVFAFVCRRVLSRPEAEDITAEVIGVAAGMPWKLRGDASDRAWLLAIARHKIADAARRRNRQREMLDVDLTDQERETLGILLASDIEELPEEAYLHEESRRMMRQLLAQLPDDQREAILLQVEQDLPIREIARLMGRTVAATNSLLQRARASLLRRGKDYFTS
jgi:RNA polymerase sigma-70 factor (ECF subfamily)